MAVPTRLVASAARIPAVAASVLPAFPPQHALYQNSDVPKPAFDTDAWAAAQPPPPSALVAFAHRLGLAAVLSKPDLVQQACTHPSFVPLHRQFYPDDPRPATNAQLSPLGNALMGMFASEFVRVAYPYLPTKVWKAAVTAYVGPTVCTSVAQEMGATPLVRWQRTPRTVTQAPVMHSDALASVPRAITALIYQHRSLPSARQFVHSYFLTRKIDIQSMLKFVDPKKALLEMVHKFGREKPVSRLLKETGRFSNSPIYVVGIFSGADKLGEGHGSSLKMAEFRAAEDALHRVYLTRTPDHLIQLPSSTFPLGLGDVFRPGQEAKYDRPEPTMAEVSYASSGRSKLPSLSP
ncbi:60S ribosomal protein L3 [Macrolepiota fuliginosa MF-IS2]|uniref:Large ribosomal subunit protein mL44 n=1 Tax=Macrolepiota fuliginosa MF-IS2 TaxID=1400762 RepID=A0A9P6C6E0_9AGAR|nr:60S ribosomal protein L3 [Macrolepiota fuliginosa MF-IS2]